MAGALENMAGINIVVSLPNWSSAQKTSSEYDKAINNLQVK
ncbi:hypothetical protein MtrunA17_Chr7g0239521 [Medicago truncatula]|uniref:Uncharacterized protein n=1 Tax=Medicago truncatula TaxID=3880 RepID=A0A396GYL8_MEDTR|nr:hypothetical protein MtrunA17_Chr7g0239521 [Medicago truncatula]